MPFNFMELSQSYRRDAENKVRARRNTVVQSLDKDYRLPRGTADKIMGKIQTGDFAGATRNSIYGDTALFYHAYDYLISDDETKKETLQELTELTSQGKHVPLRLFGIRCLIQDNIQTWEDILRLQRDLEPAEPETPARPLAEADQVDLVGAQVLGHLKNAFVSSTAFVEQLLEHRRMFLRKIQLLEKENRQLVIETESLIKNLEQAQQQSQSWQDYSIELDKLLKDTEHQKLQELAERVAAGSERGREVLLAVQRFVEEQRERRQTEERQELVQSFPAQVMAGQYTGLALVYENKFLENFLDFQNGEQTAIRQATEKLAEYGREYSSLESRPIIDGAIEGVEKGSFLINATDEIRLIWHQEENTIHFSHIARKGDKWLHSSEA